MTRVAVVGATGFVGEAVTKAFRDSGVEVSQVVAPRLRSRIGTVDGILAEAGRLTSILDGLAESLEDCDVVVNAAGLAHATGHDLPAMLGANALLPACLAIALLRDGGAGRRLIHVSSAAVQGHTPCLTESRETFPFSVYSVSKALGETALLALYEAVIYRPTSVHGPTRNVTRSLVKLAASPVSSVAGRGDQPTPQVLVQNVASAVTFLADPLVEPPAIALHPWEGFTVAELLRVLGGREPRHLPERLARTALAGGLPLSRMAPRIAGSVRRLEMLWFGQRQEEGWLDRSDWTPPAGIEAWEDLRMAVPDHKSGVNGR